jgi:hypothetical protein
VGVSSEEIAARVTALARVARAEGIASLSVSADGAVTMTLAPTHAPAESADLGKLREADEARRQRLKYAHVGGA